MPHEAETGMADTPKPERRWFQYSLRTLLVFVTLCAIPCSWYAVRLQQARQQKTVAAIQKLGGVVGYDWQFDAKGQSLPSAQQPGLRSLWGNYVFQSVYTVNFDGDSYITDEDIEHLRGLSQLRYLHLRGTQVTDKGVENLRALSQLQGLDLHGTKVTDKGLEHFRGLSQLQGLDLYGTKITDKGLENLNGLAQLRHLRLGGYQCHRCARGKASAGIAKLQD